MFERIQIENISKKCKADELSTERLMETLAEEDAALSFFQIYLMKLRFYLHCVYKYSFLLFFERFV